MIRFLVTLLVLMSGLAAEGVAADARVYGACTEIGAVETGARATRAASCAVTGGIARAAAQTPRLTLVLAQPAALTLPSITVLPGIDRARE